MAFALLHPPGGGSFVRPAHRKDPSEGETYLIPSPNDGVFICAPQRMSLLDQWRRNKRYKLTQDEKRDLFAMRSRNQMISYASYFAIGGTWWVTGSPNTPAFYETFPLQPHVKQNLLQLQKVKLAVPLIMRCALSFAACIPFAVISTRLEDGYFTQVLESRTLYGAFARYLKQQGDRLDNGEVIDPYVHGQSYFEAVPNTKTISERQQRREKRREEQQSQQSAVSESARVTEQEQLQASSASLYRGGGLLQQMHQDEQHRKQQVREEDAMQQRMQERIRREYQAHAQGVSITGGFEEPGAAEPPAAEARQPQPPPQQQQQPRQWAQHSFSAEPEPMLRRVQRPKDSTDAFFQHVFGA